MGEVSNNNDTLNIEIKIISNEILKPSKPTSIELQKFILNSFDQASAPIHCQMVLFYPNQQKSDIDPNILKKSLCDTLTCYYPLAGRCENESIILCQDQGVPFYVTRVNCELNDVINSQKKKDLYTKFMPPQDKDYDVNESKKLSDLVIISFQINVFLCGGVAIGCEYLHKLMDMASLSNFFIYWAAVATNKSSIELAQLKPDFEASVKAFPPSPDVPLMLEAPPMKYLLGMSQSARVVARSFMFTSESISDLRTQMASEDVQRPTRFEAVGAFVWEHALGAACAAGQQVETTRVLIFANLRTRMSPPLPKGTTGNLVTYAKARAENKEITLSKLAGQMHAALSKFKKCYEETKDENDYSDMMYNPGFFKISSWCKLGLNEAEFGFGKPWIVPTNGEIFPIQRNFIYITEDLSGTGIEVWVFLEVNEMKILESDSKFLALALPN